MKSGCWVSSHGYLYHVTCIILPQLQHDQQFLMVSRLTISVLSMLNGLLNFPWFWPVNKHLANVVWMLGVWSWWCVSYCLPESWFRSWNSSITLTTSGPATIQHLRAAGLSWGQQHLHLFWCRHYSVHVPGQLGLMRKYAFIKLSGYLRMSSWKISHVL